MGLLLVLLLTATTIALLALLQSKYNYWKKRGVPHIEQNVIWNSIFKLNSMHHSDILQELYDTFKGKTNLAGFYVFTRPVAVILDLDLVKNVLIRDFSNFVNRTTYKNPKEVLSQHLFLASDNTWRNLRTQLSSTFTSGKMKFMFPTLIEVANQFAISFDYELEKSVNGCLDVYELNGRFTTDVIGTCVFGIECNSLKNSDAEFRVMGRRIFKNSQKPLLWRLFLVQYANFLKYLGIKRIPQFIEDFFIRIVQETVVEREKLGIHRNDFIDLLIELKNTKEDNDRKPLSLDMIAAQLFVFFAAGFETSSSNMSYGLFELAKNLDVQEKVRNEINTVLKKYDGKLTYEGMLEMTYLDQMISETLRLYPALAFLLRFPVADYRVPDSNIILQRGAPVFIPVKAIHCDPNIYENPLEFRPERFHPSEIQKRHPQAFLGFGDGPRNCIGMRFGRMQARVGLITLLSKYKFSLSSNLSNKIAISKDSFVLIPESGVYLKVDKL